MRSSRTIQTIVQALTLVLVAAIFFSMPKRGEEPGSGGTHRGVANTPSDAEIKQRYRQWFNDYKDDLPTKATLLSVNVDDLSIEGAVAQVRLTIEFRWEGHNINYTEGPLKNAPGQRGDTVSYTEVFTFRRWSKGWDIEGHRKPSLIR